ncbi:CDP-diacylglycerol--glycerol-3-phosphate 3-phosphatidyltransferase [Catenulispora sp. GAS73]|uniref:CDP-diacylglycerol--glycerol-3-phosphate 3-phosphatidyltransferase n=1 Tax=Catenulispora sp. GAS73 TaxID=3156269 RepID=UPI0035124C15
MKAAAPDPLTLEASPAGLWNMANILTMVRLLLVPFFGFLLAHDHGRSAAWRAMACAVFVVANITDTLDGKVARARNLVTDFGKIADPIADKALMGTALVILSALGELNWWITIVILARELGITLLRFWVLKYGVIAASQGGKLKTFLQGFAILFYLIPTSATWWHWVSVVTMAAALVLTVATGVDYVMRAVRLRWSGTKR